MQTVVNSTTFQPNDETFVDFYNQHGWVVIDGVLPPDMVSETTNAWSEMKTEFAIEMGMSLQEYQLEVSQWRDLWRRGGVFRELIFGGHINSLVTEAMGWNGTRLLHDHLIAKPRKGSNKKIPWHQDSMFWPVDLPGCSSWVALVDVGVEDGCLEVIDKSHLEGCEEPVDFMAKEREEFPEDSIKMQLPISAGSMILLHSLTWHRSSPNKGLTNRPAHLGLWVHSDAKWRPDLVDWHPVNEHVESEPGSRMEGERFPSFGEIDIVTPPEVDIHSGTIRYNDISMFDASKIIGKQLAIISEAGGGIVEVLSDARNIETIVSKTIDCGFCEDADAIRLALNRLWVSYSAYQLHRARNVYNDAYAHWWELAGSKWNDELDV
jgi:phytanoyl-CoA hydroxylase|tara:strand:+ start:505 stop:1638 length:1134 start_codon:yes stop_codon:yes gene_type:complete